MERHAEDQKREFDAQCHGLRQTIQDLHDRIAPPADLDKLRADLIRELEAPHSERVDELEQQVEATRQLLVAARKRFETLKVSPDSACLDDACAFMVRY